MPRRHDVDAVSDDTSRQPVVDEAPSVAAEPEPVSVLAPVPEPAPVVTFAQFVAAARQRPERLAGFRRWVEIRGYPPRQSIAAWHALLRTFTASAV